ncbi:hypothetical protein Efla_003196 [Eimeria flavescens]
MVRKALGSWRLCCDYRGINKHVNISQQPLPRTDDILTFFTGKRYFSVLVMCSGYYQIQIEEQDRPKTSFVTPDCQRQYKRLPIRFASSPATIQHLVDMLLGGMKPALAMGYIDDIIVYSDSRPEHKSHLRQLCEAFARPTFSSTWRSAILELPPSGISDTVSRAMASSRTRCLARWQSGLPYQDPGYFGHGGASERLGRPGVSRQVPILLEVHPELFQCGTTVKHGFQWSEACDLAWRRLRDALRSEPPSSRTLTTRASSTWTFQLPQSEVPNYRRVHRAHIEARFVCACVLHIRAPLSTAARSETSDKQELDVLLSGDEERADRALYPAERGPGAAGRAPACAEPERAASSQDPRPPTGVLSVGGRQVALSPPVKHDDIRAPQQQDPICQKLFPLAASPRAQWPSPWRTAPLAFSIHELLLWASVAAGPPRVVLYGPLPITQEGNTYTVVFTDHHTRWVELVPVSSPSATALAQAFINYSVRRWGAQRALLLENRPQSTAELFKQFCERLGVTKIYTSPYNPRGTSRNLYSRGQHAVSQIYVEHVPPLFSQAVGRAPARSRLGLSCYASSGYPLQAIFFWCPQPVLLVPLFVLILMFIGVFFHVACGPCVSSLPHLRVDPTPPEGAPAPTTHLARVTGPTLLSFSVFIFHYESGTWTPKAPRAAPGRPAMPPQPASPARPAQPAQPARPSPTPRPALPTRPTARAMQGPIAGQFQMADVKRVASVMAVLAMAWSALRRARSSCTFIPALRPTVPYVFRTLWPAPFERLERLWDGMYAEEFPEVIGVQHWSPPSWTDFPTDHAGDVLASLPVAIRERCLTTVGAGCSPTVAQSLMPVDCLHIYLALMGVLQEGTPAATSATFSAPAAAPLAPAPAARAAPPAPLPAPPPAPAAPTSPLAQPLPPAPAPAAGQAAAALAAAPPSPVPPPPFLQHSTVPAALQPAPAALAQQSTQSLSVALAAAVLSPTAPDFSGGRPRPSSYPLLRRCHRHGPLLQPPPLPKWCHHNLSPQPPFHHSRYQPLFLRRLLLMTWHR